MSGVIETNRGGVCAICQEEFLSGDQQFTHEGGEDHNGFHRECFTVWLRTNPTCPYDRQLISPNSLLSRTDRVMARLGPAFVNAACAAYLGIAAGPMWGWELLMGTLVASILSLGEAAKLLGAVYVLASVIEKSAPPLIDILSMGVIMGNIVILDSMRIDRIARENIGIGIIIGSGVAQAMAGPELSTLLAAIALAGGATAGILSLMRG